MSSKNWSRSSVSAAAQRARDAATQAVPKARNAVPLARNAGLTARHSAEDAVARVAPMVKDARAWAAPHVEQVGLAVRDKIAPAISEKIAPAISDAIVEAAHRLDAPAAPRRRLWPRVLAGIAMLAAAGSAVAAAVLRRQPTGMEFGTNGAAAEQGAADHRATDEMAAGDSTSPTSSDPETGGPADEREGKANGQVHSS
jgi:hypothetical protein